MTEELLKIIRDLITVLGQIYFLWECWGRLKLLMADGVLSLSS